MIRVGYLMEPSAGPLMLRIEFSTNACSTPQPRDLHNSKPQRCSSHKVADPGPHIREWARPPAGARRDLLDKEAMPGDERIALKLPRESVGPVCARIYPLEPDLGVEMEDAKPENHDDALEVFIL